MTYGVKMIHTLAVGETARRIYEEVILKVDAESFDHAYEKAAGYMQGYVCKYENPDGETVRTVSIEAVDCFLACDPEGDV